MPNARKIMLLSAILALIAPSLLSAEDFPATLMYHDIKPVPFNTFDVSTKDFCAQLDWLKYNGYITLRLEDIDSPDLPRKAVIITFDDGYRGAYANAVPELRKRGMSAVFFITAETVGRLDTGYPHITQDELRDIAGDELFSLGSYTVTHPNLTALSHDRRITELTDSRKYLEAMTGRKIDALAYPYGDYDAASANDASESGYRTAFVIDVRETEGIPARMRIPRVYMGVDMGRNGGELFRRIMTSSGDLPPEAFADRYSPLSPEYDIIIAGGGMSGVSAAIQAERLGASTLIIEPTGMLGGQSTAAGVSTMDDMTRLRESGLYREFMDKIREHYAGLRKSIATSYWKTDGKAFEPSVGHKILADMAASSDILYHSEIVSVESSGKGKTVTVKTPEGTQSFDCKILIDATEYGDVIPLAGLLYRSGNSVSPDMNPDSMIQDITWTAVIRNYPKGVPETLRPKSPLPGYEKARKNYLAYVSRNTFGEGKRSPFKLPAEFSAHNGYRAIPDSQSPGSYTGARKDWKRITKTGVNWGNDYPGQYGWESKYGIPIAYLESPDFRADINRKALIKTLHFIWYVQNELGESWSIDENEYDELPEAAKDLPDEWKNIARHMPPVPYVRESRRIVGDYTYNSEAIYVNSESYRNGRKNQELTDSIAIGGYILDLHTGDDDDDFEHELGERQAAMRTHEPSGAFQVPMRIFIPASDDNFLAAEKNLSMSRLATSALRLQPVCMMTGQAVGTLAALAVSWDVKPRDVHAVHVQRVLADAGVMMSLAEYSDVPESSKYYPAVQIATLYRLIEPEKYPVYPKQRISTPSKTRRVAGKFGVDRKVTEKEFSEMLKRAESAMNIKEAETVSGYISSDDVKTKAHRINADYHDGMTRGEAVSIIVDAMDSLPYAEAAEHRVEKLITRIDSQDSEQTHSR